MPLDKQKALLFGIAAALRLFLFVAFPSLPDLLTDRVEVSTPVTSFKRRMSRRRSRCLRLSIVLTRRSTGGSIPLQAQCVPLRWRRLPSGPLALRLPTICPFR